MANRWGNSGNSVRGCKESDMTERLNWTDGTRCHDLSFWMLSFKPAFSLSSFTFIKRLFNSSSLSAITVVSSIYLRLLIFLPAVLIPACASSSLAFHMIYPAYKLNKQGDNIQPWCTPFPVWSHMDLPGGAYICLRKVARDQAGTSWRTRAAL